MPIGIASPYLATTARPATGQWRRRRSTTSSIEKGSGPFFPVGGSPSRALKGDAKAIAGGARRPRLSRPKPRKQQAHDIPSPAGLPGIPARVGGSAAPRADAHPRLVPDAESLAPFALAAQRRRSVELHAARDPDARAAPPCLSLQRRKWTRLSGTLQVICRARRRPLSHRCSL